MGSRGDTVMMQIAGAGHVAMLKFFYKRIVKHSWTCNLEVVNRDGRNLWSIAGLAHEDAGEKRKRAHVNEVIKDMVRHLAKLKYMEASGLAIQSSAKRGKQKAPHRGQS